ncbi:hypothetical protein Slin14017_G079200 [Septoria linicola]|nr:hypothetical protein Slin14017_G079200 [Septoria linicola]
MPAQPNNNNNEEERSTLLHSVRIAYSKMYTERLSCRRALTAAKEPLSTMPPISGLCARPDHTISDLQAIIKQLSTITQNFIDLTQEIRELAKTKEEAETEKLSQQYRDEMQIFEEKKVQLEKEVAEGEGSGKKGGPSVDERQKEVLGKTLLKLKGKDLDQDNKEVCYFGFSSDSDSELESEDEEDEDEGLGGFIVADEDSPEIKKK